MRNKMMDLDWRVRFPATDLARERVSTMNSELPRVFFGVLLLLAVGASPRFVAGRALSKTTTTNDAQVIKKDPHDSFSLVVFVLRLFA